MRCAPRAVYSVIVTFNRRVLLSQALLAQLSQTLQISHLLIVDNASTDGTEEMLAEEGWLNRGNVELLALPENTGGAGGFSAGLKHAIDHGAEWIWIMDDDAEPHPTALEELMLVADDPGNVYGSLAVSHSDTSWLTTVLDPPLGQIGRADEVPSRARVQSLPFLGFLIHRSLVERIGLPDAGYFIAADDVEYCVRARKSGADIIIAGQSRIEHPKSRPSHIRVMGHDVVFLSLAPWKRYYDTRNRLLVARSHYGLRFFTHTIPGSFVRLIVAMIKEPNKLAQLRAFSAGFFDGLLGIKGKRHEYWGIK
ncbi:GT2 family glycosyltransferase [Delftia acidovorans]|uniref:glycosyltransferase family 2 protein n=1 Tax=Delftia acidovorans TaxID=80866 RepID=UPI000F4B20B0|nr:glycosyltransferase family 2 protein [Delftia acidovorans]ROQ91773.1 GT2 family glycosyltransferase [Delftia acidovorans]